MNHKLIECLKAVRQTTPLVQAITNYVTVNDCANILLAAGASPAMCEASDEVFEFSQMVNALYLNVGTLTKEQEMSMYLAVRGASLKGNPIILDPVACGAIPRKKETIERLHKFGQFTVIKGNLGEIKALAGVEAKVRGVDSLDEGEDGLESCKKLAQEYGCVVAATGKTDIVTNGQRACLIENGTEILTRITGAGCMAGALVAGFCGANNDAFLSTAAALLTMSIAGELAQEAPGGDLPGTFRVHLIDQISLMDEEALKRGRVQWL
ncbi:hydroxyethylthiazole kinase [Desulfosporosinus youngiae]|uniref:Hydroxyethylthiazole kinase n=1 Tax=Desulfosporosinus youngiae DSM 17734 TaxID=768710 RepID=H5Y5Z3_9FIRM|nr:hydroxyethylthiazole kinase [Desulfosporosinus youngiae]EHQ90932.1 hydroxyethylthiazole kinase [Desulfosporosinus youngiae DSM 17734]